MTSPEELAKRVTEMIAKESFRIFRRKKFRELNNFPQIDQTEQDRIFNELVASGLALSILMFETIAQKRIGVIEQYLMHARMETLSCYGNMLRNLGVEEEFAGLWKGLIKMRSDEYRKDLKIYLKHGPKTARKNPWPIIVSIGGFKHVTRGKGKPQDPLYKIFLDWICDVTLRIDKILFNGLK